MMKIKSPLWLKLLAIGSTIIIVSYFIINARDIIGSKMDAKHISLYLFWCLLPAFISIFVSFAQKYWISLAFGIWFLFMGFFIFVEEHASTEATTFLFAAIVMCSIPFLNLIFGQKLNNIDSKINPEGDI